MPQRSNASALVSLRLKPSFAVAGEARPTSRWSGQEPPQTRRGLAHQTPIANAVYKRQQRNPGVTEIVKVPNRGHAPTIDHGWREVAQTALDFVNRNT